MLLLTVGAAVLRFAFLGRQSYWYDESLTVDEVRLPFGSMLAVVGGQETSPPLYFVLAWGWARIFGSAEVGLRALSAVCGTIAVPLSFGAAGALLNRRAGVLTAALVATSPMVVWYSQEARAYGLLLALSALSLWCMVQAAQGGERRWVLGWAVGAAAALATHFFAAFLIVPEAVWLLWSRRKRDVRLAVAGVVAVELALLPLAWADRSHGLGYIHSIPLAHRLGDTAVEFAAGNLDGRPDAVVLVGAAWILAATSLWRLWRCASRSEQREALTPAVIAFVALALPLVLAAAGFDYIYARNLLPALLPLTVTVAAGVTVGGNRRLGFSVGTALVCVCLTSTLVVFARSDLQRPDWHGAARALGAPAGPRAILAVGEWQAQPLKLYIPNARLPAQPITIGELDLVGLNRVQPRRSLPSHPPFPRLQRINDRLSGPLGIARYRLSRPLKIAPSRLRHLATRLFTRAPGRLRVLFQPSSAPRAR